MQSGISGQWGGKIGKRSNFEKRPRDYYPTPLEAVSPLKGLLPTGLTFCEPCAGDGRLVEHLEGMFEATCFWASDIEPNAPTMIQKDGLDLEEVEITYCDYIITNPPFTWGVLKPLMDVWIGLRPTLLLLPADFLHNKRVAPYIKKCVWAKSIGRVRWIEGSKTSGVDNYIWAMFDKNFDGQTIFYERDI